MQQTANYKLNLIETNDLFSPEALNENARTIETALAAEKTRVNGEIARVDAALATEKARVDAALNAKANQTDLAALTQTVTANKSAADAALAAKANQADLTALTQTVTANKSAADAALNAKAAQTALTALTTRVTALEQGQLRYKVGSYPGTGTSGSASPNRLAFDFKPLLVIIVEGGSYAGGYPWIRSQKYGVSYANKSICNFVNLTWEERAVSWYYGIEDMATQLNSIGKTYHYVAIGIT